MKFIKNNILFILIVLLFALTVAFFFLRGETKAKHAQIIDGKITVYQDELNSPFILKGKAFFYWKKFITYQEYLESKKEDLSLADVNQFWVNNAKSNKEKFGYASYVFEVELKDFDKEEKREIAMEILPFSSGALEVEVNGKLIAQKGILGKTRDESQSALKNTVFSFVPDSANLVFIFRVSEFNITTNGYFPKVFFGGSKEVFKERMLRFIIDLAVIGFILFMIINNLLLYFTLREKYILSFVGLFFFVLVANLISGEKLIFLLFPSYGFSDAVLKVGDSSVIFIFFFLNLTFYFLIKEFYDRRLIVFLSIFTIISTLFYLLLPIYQTSFLFNVYSAIFLVISLYLVYITIKLKGDFIEKNLLLSIITINVLIGGWDSLLYLDRSNLPAFIEQSLPFRPFFIYFLTFFFISLTILVARRYKYFQENQEKVIGNFKKFVPLSLIQNKEISALTLNQYQEKNYFLIFFDIKNFSSLTEKTEAKTLVTYLNNFYDFIFEIIKKKNGNITKFIGDAAVVFFPDDDDSLPFSQRAKNMVELVFSIFEKLKEFNQIYESFNSIYNKNYTGLSIRLALHYGKVTFSVLGSPTRTDLTAIDENYFLLFKMESIAKKYQKDFILSDLLITPEVKEKWKDKFNKFSNEQINLKENFPIWYYKGD